MTSNVSLKLPFILGYIEDYDTDSNNGNTELYENGKKCFYDEHEITLSNIDTFEKNQIDVIKEEDDGGDLKAALSVSEDVGNLKINSDETVVAAEVHMS